MVGGEECRFGHPHLHRLVAVTYWQGMNQWGRKEGGRERGRREGEREEGRREGEREKGGWEGGREGVSKQVHEELSQPKLLEYKIQT